MTRAGAGRMKNIAQHVGSGPWPGAMRVADPFQVVCASTKVLNSISFEKDGGGKGVQWEYAVGGFGILKDEEGMH